MRRPNASKQLSLNQFARIPATYLWVAGLAFVIHVFGKHPDYSYLHGTLAGLGGAVVACVMLSFFRAGKDHVPILEWAFLQYYVFWVSPVFFEGEAGELVTFTVLRRTGQLTMALLAILVFMVSVLVGFVLIRRVLPARKKRQRIAQPISEVVILVLAVLSLFVHYQILMRENESLTYYFLLFVVMSPNVFLIVWMYERQHFRPTPLFGVAFYLFVGAAVVVGLTSGRLTHAIMPVVAIILAQLSRGRRINWGYPLLAVFMIVLVNPVKIVYRDLTGFRTSYFSKTTLSESFDALARSMEASWGGGLDRNYDENMEQLTERLNEQTKTATVFYLVPNVVRYEGGTTLWPIFYGQVPRMLWREKPNITRSTTDYFNVKLGFQTPSQTLHTTEAMPMVAEAYFNFGWPGIVLLAFLSGAAFAFVAWLFDERNRILYVATLYVVINLEVHGGFVRTFGGPWKMFLVAALWAVVLGMIRRRGAKRVATGPGQERRTARPSAVRDLT